MCLIGETCRRRDIRHSVSPRQEFKASLKSELHMPRMRGHANDISERANQQKAIDTRQTSKVEEAHIAIEMLGQVCLACLNSPQLSCLVRLPAWQASITGKKALENGSKCGFLFQQRRVFEAAKKPNQTP